MASDKEIAAEVRRFILSETLWGGSPELLTDDYPLLASGQLDSFDLADLIAHLETCFGIAVDLGELAPRDLGHIGAVTALVRRNFPEQDRG